MIAGRRLPVSACVGVALASSSGTDDAESLLRSGDIALWEAKRGGKGRVAHFDPETGQSYADRLQLVADLVRALEDGELEGGNQLHLHYQPIVQLGSAEVVGVEALARWEHPTRGLVPPMEFIPLAEENGLILPLGTWVLREACRQVRQWDERVVAAGGSPALSVSVNLSVRQLEETGLIDEVRAVLADTGLPANRLVLEVTESVLVRETDIVIANLRQLRELGVRIALDDFGTGYSALNYLQRFPIDVLKIDRSFVNGLTDPDSRLAVVQAIISIAQGLQLRTVAEGIESSTVDSQLQELGCHFGQGYLYSRPLPPKAIEDWLLQTSALALPHDELRDTAA
jgi:EAL domain-containing protein (putative c-di-GMP-specific phosphodiesterase class I)